MRRFDPRVNLRVLPELRSAQIKDDEDGPEAQVIYFDTNYDLAGTAIPSTFRKVGLPTAMRVVFSSGADVLEVPEPLWIRFLPKTVAIVAAWRLGGIMRLRTRKARSFAIENNDPVTVVFGRRRVPEFLATITRFLLGIVVNSGWDRIAFGSDGAAKAYGQLRLRKGITSKVIWHLAAAAEELAPTPKERQVIFVGRLERRKGIPELMQAWRLLQESRPEERLLIIGSGELAAEVEAQSDSQSMLYVGPLPHGDSESLISKSSILVAPSVPDGRWREQIGLPILEGLSHGLTIVTTDQSGLSAWLGAHGHYVIPIAELSAERLAQALATALSDPLPVETVLGSLPTRRGRIEAAEWLYSNEA